MANSLPFNAVAVDGEYDRVYKAEDWAWYFATFIANGIFPKPSDGLQVVAYSGMEIRVNAGYAFINGYAFRNPATLSVTLDTAEGALNRVDRVVVRWDLPQRDMYIAVLKGTPSAKPTATAVTRTTEIWELALADIYVGKGVTRIQTQNITDQRFNSAVCGIVTGTVEEIDASVLTKQFTDFFNTYSAAVLDEFSAYKQNMEKYLAEIAGVYDSYVSKTEGLFAQYESQFNERYSSFENTLDNWDKELLSAYTDFMAKIKLFQSDAENEFNTWFESIKDKLGEDIAGRNRRYAGRTDRRGKDQKIAGYGAAAYLQPLAALIAGGNWNNGANCGARAVNCNNYPWNVNTNIGARGACDLVRTLQAQSSTEYWQGLRKG